MNRPPRAYRSIAQAVGKLAVAALLGGCGSPIPVATLHNTFPLKQNTRLILASGAGDLEAMQLALDQGEKVDDVNEEQYSALHFAVANGQAGAVHLLLEKGADPSCATDVMFTPLHMAVFKGDDALVAQLLSAGAKPNVADAFGKTPLHHAAADQKATTVVTLLQGHANVVKASDEPWDLHTTAYSYQALASWRKANLNNPGAREALGLAAQFYDQADRAYQVERQRTEKALRNQIIQSAVLAAVAGLAGSAMMAGASYQARSDALKMAQIGALRKTAQRGGGPDMYFRQVQHEYQTMQSKVAVREFVAMSQVHDQMLVPAAVQAAWGAASTYNLRVYIQQLTRAQNDCEALAKRTKEEEAGMGTER